MIVGKKEKTLMMRLGRQAQRRPNGTDVIAQMRRPGGGDASKNTLWLIQGLGLPIHPPGWP